MSNPQQTQIIRRLLAICAGAFGVAVVNWAVAAIAFHHFDARSIITQTVMVGINLTLCIACLVARNRITTP